MCRDARCVRELCRLVDVCETETLVLFVEKDFIRLAGDTMNAPGAACYAEIIVY